MTAFFMLQGRYTQGAIKNLMAKPEDRSKAAAAIAKACGGTLLQYYMSLGKYDFMAVMEFPNVEAATACSMAVAAGGQEIRKGDILLLETGQGDRTWPSREFAETARRLCDEALTTGTTTIEIKTGSRSIISYLLSPLIRYKHESLRER